MTKTINCPKCGEEIHILNSLGRKSLNISAIFICGALQRHSSVAATARKLACSRGYIYKELAKTGLKPAEFLRKVKEVRGSHATIEKGIG